MNTNRRFRFTASLDKLARVVTVGFFAFVIVIGSIVFTVTTDDNRIGKFLTITILLLVLFISYLWRPLGYAIDSNYIIVRRPARDVKICRRSVVKTELVEKGRLLASIRTFGVGGLFGYYGYFANKTYGHMIWHATRRDPAVLIITDNGRKIILTPDDPDGFLEALNN